MSFKVETVRVSHLENYAKRERKTLEGHEMVGLIFGPFVPKVVRRAFKDALFARIALEEFVHTDPRLGMVAGEPQNTFQGRKAGMHGMSLRALKSAYVPDAPARFYHLNYLGLEEPELVITCWEREETPQVHA